MQFLTTYTVTVYTNRNIIALMLPVRQLRYGVHLRNLTKEQ